MPPSRVLTPSRRLLLLGALTAPLAGAVLPAAGAQAPVGDAAPECLADLIESGEVTRADLVAR